jgi:succinate dehydrogenase / fumarate reductase, cytochrome b subunit
VTDCQRVVATTGQGLRRTRLSIRETWDSTVGKKIAVAISGAILVAYLVLHMVGNLNAFAGAGGGHPRDDRYAHWLRTFGEPLLPYGFLLWAVRVLLVVALVVHVTGVIQIRRRSAAARGPYKAHTTGRTLSARLMLVTGTIVLGFIVFHILQFTTLSIHVTPVHHGEVYANLYYAFQKWYFVLLYVVGVGCVCFHLRHGLWSACQTLGLDRPTRHDAVQLTCSLGALTLFVGFIAVPICFWTGVLGAP